MKMRDVTVAVPEGRIADFYLLVGRWLAGTGDESPAGVGDLVHAGEEGDTHAGGEAGDEPRQKAGGRGSRYDGIAHLLGGKSEPTLELTFGEIEGAIGGSLPASASRHRAWWSNTERNAHARAWLSANYRLQSVDFDGRTAVFQRQ